MHKYFVATGLKIDRHVFTVICPFLWKWPIYEKGGLKPGVHTNVVVTISHPIHCRHARIHRSPTENYMSNQKSTYSFS